MNFSAGPRILLLNVLWAGTVIASQLQASRPVLVSYEDRPVVVSPDGKWQLIVLGEKERTPWLVLESRDGFRSHYQKWPIQRSGWVLWRPDSQAFALTDAQFSNHYFVRVLYVEFKMGGSRLGSPVTDLSPTIEKHFEQFVGSKHGEINKLYPKVLRWLPNGHLLIGMHAVTIDWKKTESQNPKVQESATKWWFRGYVVDVGKQQVIRDLDAKGVLNEFRIDLEKETR